MSDPVTEREERAVAALERLADVGELDALEHTITRLREEIPGDRTKRDAEILRLEQAGARIRLRLWPPATEKAEESADA